jgi:hypothetical protein
MMRAETRRMLFPNLPFSREIPESAARVVIDPLDTVASGSFRDVHHWLSRVYVYLGLSHCHYDGEIFWIKRKAVGRNARSVRWLRADRTFDSVCSEAAELSEVGIVSGGDLQGNLA